VEETATKIETFIHHHLQLFFIAVGGGNDGSQL